ncbi:3-hydroxybutyrate dehydrogenase [Marinicella sp. W31]|uniref:3-hydroxybutyrate dehydrogenase n=1 Tax=Marinicella sp. W31 TaxID=3023713 RepID=UPI0037563702
MKIIITGAGSGIGKSLVENLVEAGHHVFVTDYALDAVNRLVDSLQPQYPNISGFKLDVTDKKDLEQLRQKAQQESFDVLINNAGLQHVERIEDFPMYHWHKIIDVMLMGSAMCIQAVLPAMKQQNFGRIVNIGSVHSLVASAYKSAYVSAKHGLLGLAKTVALEMAEYDITINTVCPGYVDTPMVRDQISQQAQVHNISEDQVIHDVMLKNMPKKTFVSVQELAAAVAFFMDKNNKNTTAQYLAIDGGWTAQ